MGDWTHSICVTCWAQREPDRVPHQVRGAPSEPCCFCGARTEAGIYVRENPERLKCNHDEKAEGPR